MHIFQQAGDVLFILMWSTCHKGAVLVRRIIRIFGELRKSFMVAIIITQIYSILAAFSRYLN